MSFYIWVCIWTGKKSPIALLPDVQFLPPLPLTSEELPTSLFIVKLKRQDTLLTLIDSLLT